MTRMYGFSKIYFGYSAHDAWWSRLFIPVQPCHGMAGPGGRFEAHWKMTLAAVQGTLLGPWLQAAAARRHLKPGRAAGSKPAKRWLWRPCNFFGLGGRLQLHGGMCDMSPLKDVAQGTVLGPWWQAAAARRHLKPGRAAGSKPAKRWLWRPCKAPSWALVAGCSCTEAFEAGPGGRFKAR